MADNAKWYVVHTYSGYEKKVATTIEKAVENRNLQSLIHAVMVPVIMEEEITAENQKKEVERKLFPGYVLIKMVMNDETWHVVRNTRGVTGFIGPGSKPEPLTDEEVASLGMEKKEITLSYAVDDSVKIIDGPLDGFIGTVEEIDTGRNLVRVVVSMFGRETPVELELEQVEPIE